MYKILSVNNGNAGKELPRDIADFCGSGMRLAVFESVDEYKKFLEKLEELDVEDG